jgi:Predicted unsaturated glucuronyl hydrolase involved in regulation of bacterial surface properties, and related proteins
MKFNKILILGFAGILFSSFSNKTVEKDALSNFPKEADPVSVGLKVSERFLSRPHSSTGSWYTEEERAKGGLFNYPVGYIVYPDVCAWYGALLYSEATNNETLFNCLRDRAAKVVYGEEQNLIPVANHVDNNIFGVVPLEIYSVNKDKRFLTLGTYMADEQFKKLSSEEYAQLNSESKKFYNKGLSWNSRMWIDDMYMLTILQVEAYKATGESKYIEWAGKEMATYLDELQKENGLFHHADNVPIYWGRGNGWVAAGMAELLDKLPKNSPYYKTIMNGYKKMMETLLKYQDKNGMWHQIVDDANAWPETSCTGMFTFAFIKGVKNGWLGNEYALAARKGWISLCGYINKDADVTDICIGTNKKNDYQYYLDRAKMTGDLHGQAPVLWCAAALLR